MARAIIAQIFIPPTHSETDWAIALHAAHLPSKILDLSPIGEFIDVSGIRRSLGHPHDESNHRSIKETVAGIVELAREYGQTFRLPHDLP
jgi:hypothetical protein